MANEDIVSDSIRVARMVKQTYGRSSLTRSAQDTIAQFSCVMSSDIPTDDQVVIAKSLEAQYAALLVSVISANSDYDRGHYANPSDYLKVFHNNSMAPSALLALTESEIPTGDFSCEITSATTCPAMEQYVCKDVTLQCWNSTEDLYNTSTLNGAYHPEGYTQSVMESVVSKLRTIDTPAMEMDKDMMGAPTKADRVSTTIREGLTQKDENGNTITDKRGNPIRYKERIADNVVRAPAATGKQEVVRNDRMTSLEPTLINIQLTSHHGDAPVITHNVVMGVKVMTRSIPQSLMISNLADAVRGSRKIFQLVKWTEGEYKFIRDFIFGITKAREDAVANNDMQHWIRSLKRRKEMSGLSKIMGNQMPPIVTVVATTYEAAKIMEETGMDISNPYTAAKLISSYYFLGFLIYNPENGNIKAMFDGDTSFNSTSLSSMKTKQQKDTDLTQFSSFLRAAGRM